MTDDLVKRLRDAHNFMGDPLLREAADRIEALERELSEEQHSREIAAAKAWEFADRIQAMESALAHIYTWYPISVTQPSQTIDEIREFARAALERKR